MATGATVIRRAASDDPDRLAWIHVKTWQQAYAGLLPQPYLDGLTDELPERAERWREWVSAAPPWVAEVPPGDLVGFASCGQSNDDDAPSTTGEVFAIYVLAEHWGRGVGRRLMNAALDSLRQTGFNEATLWVLDGNERARRFYEAGGWSLDGATKQDERDGFVLSEIRYRIRLS